MPLSVGVTHRWSKLSIIIVDIKLTLFLPWRASASFLPRSSPSFGAESMLADSGQWASQYSNDESYTSTTSFEVPKSLSTVIGGQLNPVEACRWQLVWLISLQKTIKEAAVVIGISYNYVREIVKVM